LLLPTGKPQEALDSLGTDDTAEAHYLKSLALTQLYLPEPARSELEKATAKDPKNPRYRALQLSVRIQQAKPEEESTADIDELLKIYADNTSSPLVALCAMTAYSKKKDLTSSMSAFRTSV